MSYFLQRPLSFEFDLRARAVTFALVTATVYAVSVAILGTLATAADASLLASAVTADLAVLVPVLYWLLVVRGGAPRLSLVPVCLLSLFAAGALVPSEHHQALNALETAAIPLEIGLVGYLFWSVRRALRAEHAAAGESDGKGEWDPLTRLQSAAKRLLGPGRGAEIVAFEATVLYFAFASWRRRAPEPAQNEVFITHHRKALYSMAFIGILIASPIELVPVHWLLGLWSETAAWIVTGLSIYGLVWLVGDYRAIVLGPSRLADGKFLFRLGLRWRADILLEQIRSCQKLSAADKEALKGRKDVLRATLLGEPSHLIELEAPIDCDGPYGLRRQTSLIALSLDQEKDFEAALSSMPTKMAETSP